MIRQRKLRGLPSDNLTEEQKEMIYNMDNVSIEVKKGKDMIIHVFNDEHKFSIASDDNIEEIKDLVYKQILSREPARAHKGAHQYENTIQKPPTPTPTRTGKQAIRVSFRERVFCVRNNANYGPIQGHVRNTTKR